MADLPLAFPPPEPDGPLKWKNLAVEVQEMIVNQAMMSASNAAELAGLAAVDKSWQIMVEAKTFRHIHIALEATNNNGGNYLISCLTPSRVNSLQVLTITIEWPFLLQAQESQYFSGAQASQKMYSSICKLRDFLDTLSVAAATSRRLFIELKPIVPAIATPSFNISHRAMQARIRRNAEIKTMWSNSEMLKLSRGRRIQLSARITELLRHSCTLPMVTCLTCPPDFFSRGALMALLTKFPNLRSISYNLMSLMNSPDGWCTNFMLDMFQFGAPNLTHLVLSRDTSSVSSFDGANDVSFHSRWAYNSNNNPLLLVHIDAIRQYTRNLEVLYFEYYAAPVAFFIRFFNTTSLINHQTFQWARLQELHLRLYGDQTWHGKHPPMMIDHGAHLSLPACLSVLNLFRSAGIAAAKMPCLNKMTIYIPKQTSFYLLEVILLYAVQSRQDASLGGIWASPSTLDIWGAPMDRDVEEVWRNSISQVGRHHLQGVHWHGGEWPDFS